MASDAASKIAAKHNAAVAKTGAVPAPGHNSDPDGAIKGYVDRLRNLEEEKQTISEDIKELKTEMKDNGVDAKAVSVVVKHLLEDSEKRAKRLALAEKVDQYKHALSLLD